MEIQRGELDLATNRRTLARGLPVLFWGAIAANGGHLLGVIPWAPVQILGLVGMVAAAVVQLWACWRLSRSSPWFRRAFYWQLAGVCLAPVKSLALGYLRQNALAQRHAGNVDAAWVWLLREDRARALFGALSLLLTAAVVCCMCKAMAEQLAGGENPLANHWTLLWRWEAGSAVAVAAMAVMAMALKGTAAALFGIGGVFGKLLLAGCGLALLVLLWRSIAALRRWTPEAPLAPEI